MKLFNHSAWTRLASIIVLGTLAIASPAEQPYSEQYDKTEFKVESRDAYILAPKKPAAGNPWVWRARFPTYVNYINTELLAQGYHVAYVDVAGLFGSPQAVAVWDSFYKQATEQFGLSSKPVLFGVSRGGLPVYNWATKNPDKVSCIVCMVPVLDFKSWPAGTGIGRGNPKMWDQCLRTYGFTEEEALAYDRNPLDTFQPLVDKQIPILHYCGDADPTVPYVENTRILEKRYRQAGGTIEVMLVPGGHKVQPNREETQHIIDFIKAHTCL